MAKNWKRKTKTNRNRKKNKKMKDIYVTDVADIIITF